MTHNLRPAVCVKKNKGQKSAVAFRRYQFDREYNGVSEIRQQEGILFKQNNIRDNAGRGYCYVPVSSHMGAGSAAYLTATDRLALEMPCRLRDTTPRLV